ncbi:Uncharacterised protein [Bordetella pertussis]|nr:Uncharacterised protein [Bordetella pertussis]CFP60879.1 Uncharacterised protein [Bordetella pertussis]
MYKADFACAARSSRLCLRATETANSGTPSAPAGSLYSCRYPKYQHFLTSSPGLLCLNLRR